VIGVLVVDDQPGARRGLRVMLDDYPDIHVVGDADSGPSAVQATQALAPDVVLMDIRMPGGDGISATRAIVGGGQATPVIAITTFDLDEYVFSALEAGASGFLLKSVEPDDLAAAVRVAARGDALVSPAVTGRVIAEFVRRGRRPTNEPQPTVLTAREIDIVRALGQGRSNAQIAKVLNLEAGTVKVHMSRIMAKLGLESRVQLVIWAFRHGLAS